MEMQEYLNTRITELTGLRDMYLTKFHELNGAILELQLLSGKLVDKEDTTDTPIENKE